MNNNSIIITEEEIVKIYNDPIYFIENYCYIEQSWVWLVLFKMFDYQKRLILEYEKEGLKNNKFTRRNIIFKKSRQLWITTEAAAYSLWKAYKKWNNILFLSKKEDDAVDIIRKTRIMWENLPPELQYPVVTMNTTTIEFINKNRIHSLPATERAWAWKSATLVIIDEFSWFPVAKDQLAGEDVWSALIPTISTWWQIICHSTIKWMWNKFYEVLNNPDNWFLKLPMIHWTEHPEFGRDKYLRLNSDWTSKTDWWGEWWSPWADEMMKTMSKEWWNQEYNWDVLQSWRPVFDQNYLNLTTVDTTDTTYESRFAIGVDLASWTWKDYSVIQVINIDTWKQIMTERTKLPLDELWKLTIWIAKKYNNAKIAFENNSWFWISFMKEVKWYSNFYYQQKLDWKTLRNTNKLWFNTNKKTKKKLIEDLQIAFEQWHLLLTDEVTKNELLTFVWWDNDEAWAMTGYYDDTVLALWIAWQCVLSYGARGNQSRQNWQNWQNWQALVYSVIWKENIKKSLIVNFEERIKKEQGVIYSKSRRDWRK